MELYLDNDIILKLSSINKLHLIEQIFQVSPNSIYILPSVIPYLKFNKKLLKTFSQKTLDYAITIISSYSKITNQINREHFVLLSGITDIDSGEQILFSIDPKNDFLILTGDKKAIIELNINPKLDSIKTKLEKRIQCLESLFLILIKIVQFGYITIEIKESNFCNDISIKNIFSQTNLTLEKAEEGLISYLNDIKNKTGNLLFP
jgi:hypothetical protein